MAQLIDLRDLLTHEVMDLYSAEEQILEALPKMIEKANNAELKKALRDHRKVTETQKNRLDEIKSLMGGDTNEHGPSDKKGFFSKLFGGSGSTKCKGTEGLIKEGEKMMGEDMTSEVMDAAIIGAAQKIEHYEISGYGTAVAYARELKLNNVAGILQKTLDEEYAADDLLTKLAVGKLNVKAENAVPVASKTSNNQSKASPADGRTGKNKSSNNNLSSGNKMPKNAAPKKSAGKKVSVKGKSSSSGNPGSAGSSGNKSTLKSVSKSNGRNVGKPSSNGAGASRKR